jgi:hypothetical protein
MFILIFSLLVNLLLFNGSHSERRSELSYGADFSSDIESDYFLIRPNRYTSLQ